MKPMVEEGCEIKGRNCPIANRSCHCCSDFPSKEPGEGAIVTAVVSHGSFSFRVVCDIVGASAQQLALPWCRRLLILTLSRY